MVWQLFAVAAAGAGALVGKGAQAYGNSVVEETNERRNNFLAALPGVIEQVKEQRVLLLKRLISYSTLLRASIGQEAIVHAPLLRKLLGTRSLREGQWPLDWQRMVLATPLMQILTKRRLRLRQHKLWKK